MNPAQKFRTACYTIEGINSFAVVIYFNYLYFYFRDTFGFNDRQNLQLAAFLGVTYIFASLWAGKIAKRIGYFTALKTGFAIMALGLLVGSQVHSIPGAIAAACVANFGMCFTWPVIEASTQRPPGVIWGYLELELWVSRHNLLPLGGGLWCVKQRRG